MADKQLPIITISREYGARGRSVARALSKELGIEFYDRDFVTLTAKASGFSEEDIRREGEDLSGRARLSNQFLSLNTTGAFTNSYDAIFQAQREVILNLAKSPCIIVGRCANYILREEGVGSFDVFLYADRAFRLKRTLELNEYEKMNPEKYLERRDHWRSTYYKAYTGHEFGYYKDYHICVDVGTFGLEGTVAFLTEALSKA